MTDHRKRQQPGYNPMNLRMPGSVKDNSSLSSLADFTLLTSFFLQEQLQVMSPQKEILLQ